MSSTRKVSIVIAAVAGLCGAAGNSYGVLAYDVISGAGTQAFGGSLGLDFTVNTPIEITRLGVFDSNADGIVGATLNAALFIKTGADSGLQLSPTLTFTAADPGELVNSNRVKDLPSPIVLTPADYTIVAWGYNATEQNGNTAGPANKVTRDVGGLISFIGGGRFGATPGAYPNSPDGGPANRYAAGTFDFQPVGGFPEASDVIAYEIPTPVAGNQAFGGSLGMDFDVNTDIIVTDLGVFDDGGNGLNLTITAHIYDRTDTSAPVATLVFSPGDDGTLEGGHRFKSLDDPLELPAGFLGTIVAEGYGAGEQNGNSGGGNFDGTILNDAGGLISFVGSGRFGTAGQFPGTIDLGGAARYGAGTFLFSTSLPVPEPASGLLLLIGCAAFGSRRSRRRDAA